jgi:hypothetical protein
MARIALFGALACGLLSPPALAKNFRWNCVYTVVAAPNGLSKEEFKLEFLHDDVTGKAVIVGNAGMADVDLHTGYLGITFLEKLPSGVVQTTTIADSGASVHSRHTILGVDKKITPSQFYGQCRMVQ